MSTVSLGKSFPGRTFYRASGGIRSGSFLVWLLPAVALAAVLALVLFWLFINGNYYFIIVPMIAALPVGGLVRLAVNKGHCRNGLVAGLAGLCAAVVLYMGYFYCGMVYHWGVRAASRPDLLPAYIKARMKTDVIREAGKSGEPDRPDAGGNWYFFSFEVGLVLLIGIVPGIQKSRRPYCEGCGRWMTRSVTPFNPNVSTAMMDALRSGSSKELAALCGAPVYSSMPNLTVGVDLCPALQEGTSRGCPVYISVKQVRQSQSVAGADPIDQAQGKLLLRTLQANSSEMAALASRFKLLEIAGEGFASAPSGVL